MYSHSTCFLRDARNRHFHFLSSDVHNQVGKLIDYHYYVGQIFVTFFRIKTVCDEFFVVVLYVPLVSVAEQ